MKTIKFFINGCWIWEDHLGGSFLISSLSSNHVVNCFRFTFLTTLLIFFSVSMCGLRIEWNRPGLKQLRLICSILKLVRSVINIFMKYWQNIASAFINRTKDKFKLVLIAWFLIFLMNWTTSTGLDHTNKQLQSLHWRTEEDLWLLHPHPHSWLVPCQITFGLRHAAND